MPKISVVMAAYNAANFIERAIRSLQAQTHGDWELIIVDDCSQDETEEKVAAIMAQDGRINYERMTQNEGADSARNRAFLRARGEWITVLDSDDSYMPDRLETLLRHATKNDAEIVGDNQYCFDESLGQILNKAFSIGKESINLTPERLVRNDGPPLNFSLGLIKPFIRREFWRSTSVKYPETVRVGGDFVFLFSILRKCRKAIILEYAGYVYTLPFGHRSRKKSSTSRIEYHGAGYKTQLMSNDTLIAQVKAESPSNKELIELLQNRGARFKMEKAWKELQAAAQQGSFLSTIRSGINPLWPIHVAKRLSSRAKETKEVSLRT